MGVWDALGHALAYWRPHTKRGLLLLAALAVPQVYKAFFAYSQRLIIDRGLLAHDAALLTNVLALLAGGFLLAAGAVLLADYLGAVDRSGDPERHPLAHVRAPAEAVDRLLRAGPERRHRRALHLRPH